MTLPPASPQGLSQETLDRLENEKIHDEMMALAREGKLDEAAIAGFDARVNAQLARINQGMEKAQADFEAAIALRKRPMLPKRFAIPVVVILILVFISPMIEPGIGKGFVFAYANTYRAAMPWIVGILLPVIGFAVYTRERKDHLLKDRYPTWGVRWPPSPAIKSGGRRSGLAWAGPLGRLTGPQPRRGALRGKTSMLLPHSDSTGVSR